MAALKWKSKQLFHLHSHVTYLGLK